MNDGKMCPICGKSNNVASNFCSGCGSQLVQNSTFAGEQNDVQQSINNNIQQSENKTDLVNNQTNSIDNSEGNKLGVVSLVLYFGISPLLSFLSFFFSNEIRQFFSALVGISFPSGIAIMIIGIIKYPNNKLLKIAMWLIIGSIFLGMIAFALFVIWCINFTCSNLGSLG